MKTKSKNYVWIYISFLIVLSFGCDFTSQIHKDILKAQSFVTNQNYSKAVDQYELILKNSPSEKIKIKIYYQLGLLYSIYLNKKERGLFYFEKLIHGTSDPLWLVKAQEKIGDINFNYLKNMKHAIKNYLTLVSFTPKLKNIDFYQHRLGLAYLYSNQLGESEQIFLSIMENSNHKFFKDAFFYLGMIRFKEKRWNDAIKFWKKYIGIEKRKDKIVQTKFLIANTYETSERLKEAYKIYYSLLGDYPNPDVIKSRLESLYERRVARKR